ncbi:MAG: sigma-70 family RNA polymerase sigma factor [Lacunisphaera sp.]
MTDSELLQQFIQGSDKAFAELVQRHVDLVFAAALRHVAGDQHGAEDIVQKVFIDLARKARALTRHPTLAGWLYSSTRYAAINAVRGEQRRVLREKQTEVMNITADGSEPRWEQIRPMIDDALQDLDEVDRQSVLLRFFGQKPFATIAVQLGISENAAQKRVDRALDRLNIAFKRRGISSTAAALGLALAESCVAAPTYLAGAVTSAALANVASIGAGTFAIANLFKIGAATTVIGIVGWVGVKWLRPMIAEEKQAIPAVPIAVNAQSARPGIEPDSAVVGEAPKVIEPTPSKSGKIFAPKPTPVRKIYMVRGGDTLKRIARAAGVSSEALRAENPGYNFARMRIGNQVFLPATAMIPSVETGATSPIPPDHVYLVEPGDTLMTIAQKRDLLPDELKSLNPETNWQRLRAGQRIRAP